MPVEPGAELTHLLGIGLDPHGLPVSLFTVNHWVANDAWLPAGPCAQLPRRFSLVASDADPRFSGWRHHFLRFYGPLIDGLLQDATGPWRIWAVRWSRRWMPRTWRSPASGPSTGAPISMPCSSSGSSCGRGAGPQQQPAPSVEPSSRAPPKGMGVPQPSNRP